MYTSLCTACLLSPVSGILVVSFVKQHFVQQSSGHLGVGLELSPNEHNNVLNCAVKGHGGRREGGGIGVNSTHEEYSSITMHKLCATGLEWVAGAPCT